MNETEAMQLLRRMDDRIQRMEARQRTQRRAALAVLCAFVLLLAAAAWAVVPRVQAALESYNATVAQVQQLGEKLTSLDLDVVDKALHSLDGVDLSALEQAAKNLEDLDLTALQDAARELQDMDLAALEESFAFLKDVDLQKLSGQVEQIQDVLGSLEGLDAAALNTAVKNLNRALEPILGLFD